MYFTTVKTFFNLIKQNEIFLFHCIHIFFFNSQKAKDLNVKSYRLFLKKVTGKYLYAGTVLHLEDLHCLLLGNKLPQRLAAENNKLLLLSFCGSSIWASLSQVPLAQGVPWGCSQTVMTDSRTGGSISKFIHEVVGRPQKMSFQGPPTWGSLQGCCAL